MFGRKSCFCQLTDYSNTRDYMGLVFWHIYNETFSVVSQKF